MKPHPFQWALFQVGSLFIYCIQIDPTPFIVYSMIKCSSDEEMKVIPPSSTLTSSKRLLAGRTTHRLTNQPPAATWKTLNTDVTLRRGEVSRCPQLHNGAGRTTSQSLSAAATTRQSKSYRKPELQNKTSKGIFNKTEGIKLNKMGRGTISCYVFVHQHLCLYHEISVGSLRKNKDHNYVSQTNIQWE